MKNKITWFLTLILCLISFLTFLHFYKNGQHMLYGDALSRMNISRKIIDNLNPGFAQVGNVWLPLPQIIMLPFISNDFLWHSGIGGAIISMIAYVVGSIFIYKSSKIFANSRIAPYIALLVYSLNINLLYLQTTAMSESLFLCFLAVSIYYFSKWIKFENKMYLIPAAISVSCLSLIRYEALAILLSSIPMVFIYTYIKSKNYNAAESNTIMYSVLAGLGFTLWTIYLYAIFGDPLYWLNFYASSELRETSAGEIVGYTQNLSFFGAFIKYFTSVIWMNGLFPTFLSIIAIPVLIFKSAKNKSFLFLPILLILSIYLFMILTLMRNTPIYQPELNFQNILSSSTSTYKEFNIRYGLLMLPVIALLCSILFDIKFLMSKILIISLILLQIYTYFYQDFSVIFQFSISINDNITQGTEKERLMVEWMKKNYDTGLIMISALKHDPQMLQLGVDYKTYIHEGAGKYWTESIKRPQKYAEWIVFDSYNNDDQVTKFLENSKSLEENYDLVYSNDGMLVYKIKTHTDIPFETIIRM